MKSLYVWVLKWELRHTMYDLTKFQYDLLAVLAQATDEDEEKYGLGIKRDLSDRYEEEINHGRLYPNLEDLVEQGLIEKGSIDKRTNSYALTEEGQNALDQRVEWLEA